MDARSPAAECSEGKQGHEGLAQGRKSFVLERGEDR